jgi:hypothetical protein
MRKTHQNWMAKCSAFSRMLAVAVNGLLTDKVNDYKFQLQ